MEVDVITEVEKKTAASFKVLLSQGWEKITQHSMGRI